MHHWTSPPDDTAEADMEHRLAAARDAVRIRLKDHDSGQASASDDAEARYRKTLERALGGPVAVSAALRAYQLACDGEPDEMEDGDRALAEAWIKASQRATADGLGGLEGAEEAWFEVTTRKVSAVAPTLAPKPVVVVPAAPPLPSTPPVPPVPSVPPDAVELPTDLFPARPPTLQPVAACEKAPARTRTRTQVSEPVPSPQLELF